MVCEEMDTWYMVMPEFGKQRLMTCAESLEELSDNFLQKQEIPDTEDKREKIFLQKLSENRNVISRQLATVSRILKNLADEAYCSTDSMERHKRQICKVLTENGLDIQNMYTVSNRNGYLEIGMTLRARHKQDLFESADIAGFLSGQLHNHMDPAPGVPPYISDEMVRLVFREEVRYRMTGALARATKEGEICSGDNYTMTELSDGSYLAAISDGMGSGEAADRDSAMVIEMLEQLLESGFSKSEAADMINDLLLARGAEPQTATLDIMKCNLYSGECRFFKAGAAPSFVKRGREIRMFTERSLALGLVAGSFREKSGDSMCTFLHDGDIVVMLSDGITESMSETGSEGISRFLEHYEFLSLADLANRILGMAILARDGYIQDDMTVLVLQMDER
ncbi:MAG: SpoIIE family protein phosphatase [Lachnospiraceae bacterium]|nr:SpoIIE family protein phosphatase [Lachnospiraceae bacterium]